MPKFYYRPHPNAASKLLFPLLDLQVYSLVKKDWLTLTHVLADSGATLSLFPFSIGKQLVSNVQDGRSIVIGGVVPGASLKAWIHSLRLKVGEIELKAPVAIANSEMNVIIFGRDQALDSLCAFFDRGRAITLIQ